MNWSLMSAEVSRFALLGELEPISQPKEPNRPLALPLGDGVNAQVEASPPVPVTDTDTRPPRFVSVVLKSKLSKVARPALAAGKASVISTSPVAGLPVMVPLR